jgi:uncharacterized membrane protein
MKPLRDSSTATRRWRSNTALQGCIIYIHMYISFVL